MTGGMKDLEQNKNRICVLWLKLDLFVWVPGVTAIWSSYNGRRIRGNAGRFTRSTGRCSLNALTVSDFVRLSCLFAAGLYLRLYLYLNICIAVYLYLYLHPDPYLYRLRVFDKVLVVPCCDYLPE